LLHEKGAVPTLFGTPLRAAAVEFHRVAVRGYELCGCKKHGGVTAAKLERMHMQRDVQHK
jgi:hypothetical protein